MNIKDIKAIAFIKNLTKAYTEGVYADTPATRKLGRVGMSYAQYAEKIKQGGDNQQKELSQDNKDNNKEEFQEKKAPTYIEGIYADTPAARKLGRVGMSYEAWGNYQKALKENPNAKIEDFQGENDTKAKELKAAHEAKYSSNKQEKDNKKQENKEEIPFDEPRRGGKAFRLSDTYTLYKSNRNGKISLEIDTVGSKDLSEEEAIKLYNNYKENSKEVLNFLDKKYFLNKESKGGNEGEDTKKEIGNIDNKEQNIKPTLKEKEKGILIGYKDIQDKIEGLKSFNTSIPYKNPISGKVEKVQFIRSTPGIGGVLQFEPEEGKSIYSSQYILDPNKRGKSLFGEIQSLITYHLDKKIAKQARKEYKERKS